MPESMTQDLFDIDLTETSIQDVAQDSAAGAISGEESCFRTCTTCSLC
ncbi:MULTISPECIES: hypothetical protein [Streptomyces]|uniref:Uncharacterized protein n=1 Tax=Streptomyces formicae TaxID=1616117 RepID=A0A291Q0E5_9ACTN|nr:MULTISPECIES: hypothetical protein [Streptomyces]ATL25130.1 hypothetical protein KY5_0112 [Streptomyces formicae]